MPRLPQTGCCLLLLCALALPARAQVADAVQAFDEGNQHYVQGDYAGALAAYQQALASGYASGLLYYNMGNAYYRLDEVGQAIRYYERARQLMPENRELLHNLEITRARTTDQFSQLPDPVWRVWWDRLTAFTGPYGLFTAGFLLYCVAVALVAYRTWTRRRHAWQRRLLALSLIVGGLLLAAAFIAALDQAHSRRAVVLADRTTLRQEPSMQATDELDVHEGLVVDVLRTRQAWLEVRLPNGVTGWVEASAAGDI